MILLFLPLFTGILVYLTARQRHDSNRQLLLSSKWSLAVSMTTVFNGGKLSQNAKDFSRVKCYPRPDGQSWSVEMLTVASILFENEPFQSAPSSSVHSNTGIYTTVFWHFQYKNGIMLIMTLLDFKIFRIYMKQPMQWLLL